MACSRHERAVRPRATCRKGRSQVSKVASDIKQIKTDCDVGALRWLPSVATTPPPLDQRRPIVNLSIVVTLNGTAGLYDSYYGSQFGRPANRGRLQTGFRSLSSESALQKFPSITRAHSALVERLLPERFSCF
jgi:hypothetical protein